MEMSMDEFHDFVVDVGLETKQYKFDVMCNQFIKANANNVAQVHAQHREGRWLLLSDDASLLLQALPQMGMVGRVCSARRRGLAMTLHNVCHAAEDGEDSGLPQMLEAAAAKLMAHAMLRLVWARGEPGGNSSAMWWSRR